MEAAFAEMPLALFSTLAPMGAGAFVILAIAFLTAKLDGDALKRIDRFTAIPVGLVVVGFIAAFFHLANPLNAFGVLGGVGGSPLSNEVVVGVVFTLVMLGYWLWALSGKMGEGARRGLACVVAVLGVVFAFATGMAYMIDTIPSWNTLAGPVQMVGFSLLGGAAVGVLVLTLAGSADVLKAGSLKTGTLVVLVVGLVLGLGGFAVQAMGAAGMENGLYSGADLVAGAAIAIVCGVVCLVGTGVCDTLAIRGMDGSAVLGVTVGGVALALFGILMMRLAFYAMQMSVGLSVL